MSESLFVASLPLARAMICLEEHLFDVSYGDCPSCGSAQVLPLAKWLGAVNGQQKVYDATFPDIEAWATARGRG